MGLPHVFLQLEPHGSHLLAAVHRALNAWVLLVVPFAVVLQLSFTSKHSSTLGRSAHVSPSGVFCDTVFKQLHVGSARSSAVVVRAVFDRLVRHLVSGQMLACVEALGAKGAVVAFSDRVTVCVCLEMRAAKEAFATPLMVAHKHTFIEV